MNKPENSQTTRNPDREAGGCCGPSPCSEYPWQVIGWKARFKNNFGRWREYIVKGWTLDANGCFRTHSAGVLESFFDQTFYFPNKE
jgi:hypothetical protein